MRETQRKRAEAATTATTGSNGVSPPISEAGSDISSTPRHSTGPDLSAAQASVTAAGHKAGAYISSWGVWASERRRGWGKATAGSAGNGTRATTATSPTKAKEKVWDTAEGKKEVKRKKSVREEKGGDGIGRLDA